MPVPEIGINDVLIKIHKTAICGTDVHIWNWDAWAQKTIPVPMVIGHEFVGTRGRHGQQRARLRHRRHRLAARGTSSAAAAATAWPGAATCARTRKGVGVNRPGAFAEYLCIPVTNVWHADPSIPLEILSIFDPFGNATHTALSFNVLGEDVLITGAGPDRHHGDGHRQARRRALRRHHRRESLPAGAGQEDGRHAWR